jgi:hypothetical protein
VVNQVGEILRKTPGVAHSIELSGFSIVAGAQEPNAGSVIAMKKPWAGRGADEAISAVIAKLAPNVQCHSVGADRQLQPAIDPRHQHDRRRELRAGGAQRTVIPGACRGIARADLRGQSECQS